MSSFYFRHFLIGTAAVPSILHFWLPSRCCCCCWQWIAVVCFLLASLFTQVAEADPWSMGYNINKQYSEKLAELLAVWASMGSLWEPFANVSPLLQLTLAQLYPCQLFTIVVSWSVYLSVLFTLLISGLSAFSLLWFFFALLSFLSSALPSLCVFYEYCIAHPSSVCVCVLSSLCLCASFCLCLWM